MERRDYTVLGETIFRKTLPNGLHIQILPKPGYRRRYAFLAVNYGGVDRNFSLEGQEYKTPAGVAHFLEHKMFDTPDGGSALTALSARGASPNAFTATDTTAYYFSCTENFADNLKTLLEFVTTPYFTEESVAREQGIIGQEIRMGEDDPNRCLYYGMLEAVYPTHPIRHRIIGTAESIARITPETLYACHRAFYRPSNMVLCCVGDIDPSQVIDIARDMLPAEYRESPALQRVPGGAAAPSQPLRQREMAVAAPLFMVGAAVPPEELGLPQLRQRITGELAMRAMAGSSSAFYTKLYAEGLLTRNYGCDLDWAANTATAVIFGESRYPEAVQQALTEHISLIAEKGLEPGLFKRIKKAYYGTELRGLGRFDGLARSMAEGYFNGWCPLDTFEAMAELEAEQCTEFIRRHLTPGQLAMSVIRPTGNKE